MTLQRHSLRALSQGWGSGLSGLWQLVALYLPTPDERGKLPGKNSQKPESMQRAAFTG